MLENIKEINGVKLVGKLMRTWVVTSCPFTAIILSPIVSFSAAELPGWREVI
jgi:hypothetical protein